MLTNPRNQHKRTLRFASSIILLFGVLASAIGGTGAPLVCSVTPPLLFFLLWNPRTPIVFLASLLMQWLYVSVNIYFSALAGYFPGAPLGFANQTLTMQIINAGIVAQAAGFALVFRLSSTYFNWNAIPTSFPYSLSKLRTWTLLFAVASTAIDAPLHGSSLATVVRAVLAFRLVLLTLLVYGTCSRFAPPGSVRKCLYVIAALVLLTLGSPQSEFKEVVLISLLGAGMAYVSSPAERQDEVQNKRIVKGVLFSLIALFPVGIVWEGGLKQALRSTEISSNRIERFSRFSDTFAEQGTQGLGIDGVDRLLARMNNMWQMSLVLTRVPDQVAHGEGHLTLMAVKHVLMPRLLFANKASLAGTDRELAIVYLGIDVGQEASVGIGYLTEFYVDFGIPLMFVAACILGAILGLGTLLILRYSPSPSLGVAISIVAIWGCFSVYEANLAKAMGAFLSFGILSLLLSWPVSRLLARPILKLAKTRAANVY